MEVTDVVELLNSTSANMYADQGIFLSVLTAYMIVSYMVGRDLSRTQVLIINILFLMVTVSGAVGLSTLLARYFALAAMLPDGSVFKASPGAASASKSAVGWASGSLTTVSPVCSGAVGVLVEQAPRRVTTERC